MGRRVLRIVLLCVSAIVTVAIFAVAPIYSRPVLAAAFDAVIEAAAGEARHQLRPERRDGKLWHAYWHCLIRAHKKG